MQVLKIEDLELIKDLLKEKAEGGCFEDTRGRVFVALEHAKFIKDLEDKVEKVRTAKGLGEYLDSLDGIEELVSRQNKKWGGKQ